MASFTPQQIEQFLQEFFDVVGTRQYVGARYVPIFGRKGEASIEWDNDAPYEPLSVVMHQGVSYVSKQYVPKDVEITDTTYWAETYRFNAQVEQYRQEVLSFQSQIDDMRSDLEDDYVPFPEGVVYPKYGTIGQVLTTLANGETKWEDPVVPSDAQAEAVITEWLDAHPEATTTVLDGAITDAKIADHTITDNKLIYGGVNGRSLNNTGNLRTYLYGEKMFVHFLQGNTSKDENDYLSNVESNYYCSIDVHAPLLLHEGDVVDLDSSLKLRTVTPCEVDENGTKWLQTISDPTTPYTVPATGLYLLRVSVNPSGITDVANTVEKVWVTGSGIIDTTLTDADKAAPADTVGTLATELDNEATLRSSYYNTLRGYLYGDTIWPWFQRGSIARTVPGGEYIENTEGLYYASTNVKNPMLLRAGDTIVLDPSLSLRYVEQVTIDENGTKLVELSSQNPDAPYVINRTGLYCIIVRHTDGTQLPLEDIAGKVYIQCSSISESSSGHVRPKNPYESMWWNTDEIITTCHSHIHTDAGFNHMLAAGYTAVIPTNYRPSKPWYPLPMFFPSITGIESKLGAPNSEVSGFKLSDTATRLTHVCPLGSYMGVGDANTASYHGTFDEFVMEARRTRPSFGLGGIIINHPNWSECDPNIIARYLDKYPDIIGIEIYNYNTELDDNTGYSVDVWDAILAKGIQCFGFAAPDHTLEGSGEHDYTLPYGYVHVIPSVATDEGMLAAIGSGRFYSTLYSDSIKLTSFSLSGTTVSVSATATGTTNKVRFVTATRQVETNGLSATLTVTDADVYVRAEVHSDSNIAYTNPIML